MKAKSNLYVPPTFDEMSELSQVENLYKSNLFKLSMDECLKQISVSKKLDDLNAFLKSLKSFFTDKDQQTKYGKRQMEKTVFPVEETANRFLYVAPERFTVAGSYLLKTNVKPDLNIDLAVEFPMGTFKEKDHLNFRYLNKRHFLLSIMEEQVKKDWPRPEEIQSTSWELLGGNYLKPILVIERGPWKIRLIPAISSTAFSPIRLAPSRNSLRSSIVAKYLREKQQEENGVELFDDAKETLGSLCESSSGDKLGFPTAFYNNSILIDMFYGYHLRFLYPYIAADDSDNQEIVAALKLLKVWSRQRGFDQDLNGFVIAMLLVHMLETKKINKLMSSYQIIRVFFSNILTCFDQPMVMNPAEDHPTSQIETSFNIRDFSAKYPVCFIDPSGMINLTASFTKGLVADIKMEARMTIMYFDFPEEIGFECAFLRPTHRLLKYDFQISVPAMKKLPIGNFLLSHLLKYGDLQLALFHALDELCQKAMTDRVQFIRPIVSKDSSVHVVALVNSSEAYRNLDKGPLVEDESDCKRFREFWGDKSDLRRFPDSSIREAVVWSSRQGYGILDDLLRHIFERHLGERFSKETIWWNGSLTSVVPALEEVKENSPFHESAIIHSFDALVKQIKSLEDVPLYIKQVNGISPALRYTLCDPFAATIKYLKSGVSKHEDDGKTFVPVHEAVLQFETTNRWPNDIEAVQVLKLALLNQISQELQDKLNITSIVSVAGFLDVHKQGFIFRFHVWHEEELKMVMDAESGPRAVIENFPSLSNTLASDTSSFDRQSLMLLWRAKFQTRIKISNLCRQIYMKRPQAFRLTVMYIKRWLCNQMCFEGSDVVVIFQRLLKTHFGFATAVPETRKEEWFAMGDVSDSIFEDQIDLLICRLFLASAPYPVPGSGIVGFCRFLQLIGDWNAKQNNSILLVPDLIEESLSRERSNIDPINPEMLESIAVSSNKKFMDDMKNKKKKDNNETRGSGSGSILSIVSPCLGDIDSPLQDIYGFGRKLVKLPEDDRNCLLLGRKRSADCLETGEKVISDSKNGLIYSCVKARCLDIHEQKIRFARMQSIAKSALSFLLSHHAAMMTKSGDGDGDGNGNGSSSTSSSILRVFAQPSLSDFDLVLHLTGNKSKDFHISNNHREIVSIIDDEERHEDTFDEDENDEFGENLGWLHKVSMGRGSCYHPAQAVIEMLEARLGSLCMFFYNPMAGPVIGVVFKRHYFDSKHFDAKVVPWKQNIVWPIIVKDQSCAKDEKLKDDNHGGKKVKVPANKGKVISNEMLMVSPNVNFICQEMMRLGAGTIKCITKPSIIIKK